MKIYYNGKSYNDAISLFEGCNVEKSKGLILMNQSGMTPQEAAYSCTHIDEPKSWVERTFAKCYKCDGKYYSSLTKIANLYKVNYNQLYRTVKKGLTVDEAIAFCLENPPEKKRSGIDTFYNGEHYESQKSLLEAYEVNAPAVYSLMKRKNITFEEAFDITLKKMVAKKKTSIKTTPQETLEFMRRSTRGKEITYRGKTYSTQNNLLKEYDINPGSVYQRTKKGMSYKEALDNILDSNYTESGVVKSGIKTHNKITYKGKTYLTKTQLLKEYGINPTTVYRLIQKGMSYKEALDDILDSKDRKSEVVKSEIKKSKEITYRGKTYPSQNQLLKEYDINPGKVYRLINKGMSYTEALDNILGFTNNEPEVIESVNEPEIIKSKIESTPTSEIKHMENKAHVTNLNPAVRRPVQSKRVTPVRRKKKTLTDRLLSFIVKKIA